MIRRTVAPLIDAHLHYWEPPSEERPHSSAGMDIGPPRSVEEVLGTTGAAGVERILQVTPSCMGWDNRYALEGAEANPDRIRVFGRLDPSAPDAAEQVDAWLEHPLAVGIRLTLFRAGATWSGDPSWEPFWNRCEQLGAPVAVYAPEQSADLGALADAHPGLNLLVDHCSLSHAPDTYAFWDDLLALESRPNVVLKVSYFPEAAEGEAYPFTRAQARMREVYERFGADRMIWGSNFPPVLTACSYEQALAFVRDECGFFAPGDLEKVLGGTAIRVAGLPW
jgi:predicted TIM-barrel fold metal-dependent hydrolase